MNVKLVFILYGLLLLMSEDSVVNVESVQSRLQPPISAQRIGYNGTWDQFCDSSEIDKDFPYLHHEMRVLRVMICDLRAKNNVTGDTMAPFVAYKYCTAMRQYAEDLLEKLVLKFSLSDKQNRAELMARGPMVDATACFRKANATFEERCVGVMNPFFRMFHPLLARACTVKWLTTENVLSHIEQVCVNKELSSDVDWRTIIDSIWIEKK